MALISGTRLGPYEILAPIGAGGMGEVYKAKDTRLDRTVAIKVLPEHLAESPERKARFEREAKAISQLNHPHICTLYDVGEQDGIDYLVMEYIEGETLAERLKKGALPLNEALEYGIQIADGLDTAHRAGIVHRDLKPGNAMLTKSGIKLLDFGLAKVLAEEAESGASDAPTRQKDLTKEQALIGTLQYMAPEQLESKTADARTDIFALGVVLYEMLTGRKAFGGKSQASLIGAIMTSDPPAISQLQAMSPPALDHVVKTCLAKEPDGRWQSASDVMRELQWIAEGGSEAGVPFVAPAGRRISGRLGVGMGLGTIAVGLLAGVVAWSLKPPEPRPITRFDYELPEDQRFSGIWDSVVAVSRDGSQFVYLANQQLYLRSMDEIEVRPIQGTTEGQITSPFFSPDGQWVAYWSPRDRQLKKIAISGGAPVTLCDATNPFGASWGADDTILFGQPEGIMRVSANGGNPELLVATEEGEQVHGPQMLPDGESLLFTITNVAGQTRWDEAQIVAESLESGERKVLWTGGSDARYVPTGHLVYALEDVLFAIPFDLASLEVTGGPVPVVEGVQRAVGLAINAATANYDLSASGSLVYVAVHVLTFPERILALVDRNGEVAPLNAPPAQYLSPRLSPDGQKLAVQTLEDEGDDIWIYDLSDDKAIQQLTFEGDNQRPVWTPDSKRVTFASDRDGTMSIYWQPADGSGMAERLTTAEAGTNHWPASWSPDSLILSFMTEREGDWDIWTLSPDGEAESLYDIPETLQMGPEFSPDGKWLAYSSGAIGAQDIYVEPFPPTGARRRISQETGFWPLWSPDGSELFYRRTITSGDRTLKAVDVATEPNFAFRNEKTLPLEGFILGSRYRDYDITADGRQFLMVFPATQAESSEPPRPQINIVLNWFEELKARVPTGK